MRVTLTRLVLVPVAVVVAVAAVPFVAGDYPLTWDQARRLTLTQVSRLPGHPLADRLEDDPGTVPLARPLPSAAAPSASAPREKYPVKPVRRAWQPGAPQLGVQVYWESNGTDADRAVWLKSQRIVDYVTGLNANALTVSFPFFTRDLQASSVGSKRPTPSPHHLEILLHEAALAGLRVTVRPILDEQSLHPPAGWRGAIRPDSVPAWFDSYRTFLRPYLQASERQRVATFAVGTEFNSLEQQPHWKDLAAASRTVFSGEVVYDLNYDNYARGLHPEGMDGFGVDAYIPVKAPDTPDPATVTAAWNAFLAKVDRRAPGGVLLSEVGIPARKGAHTKPGDWTTRGAFDATVQPNWYRGVCEVARQRRLGGIYFWKVDFDANPARPPAPDHPGMDFLGRPTSEQAIRDCLGSPWTVPLSSSGPAAASGGSTGPGASPSASARSGSAPSPTTSPSAGARRSPTARTTPGGSRTRRPQTTSPAPTTDR